MRRTADAINSSPDPLRAEVKDARRVSGLDRSDAYWTDGAYLEVSLASPKLGQRLSLAEQGGDWLGLQPTANPGSDARIQVNGRTLTSETGVFSLDQGRVNLAVHGTTGETRAVTVVEAGDEMASRLSAIVESYNDLSILLSRNADLLDADFPASFRDPVADLVPGIANLGLARTPDSTLSFNPTAFSTGLGRDPATAKALLLDSGTGLLTRWAKAADAAQDGGAAKALLPPTLFADLGPPAAEQLRLEQSGRLLDVMESTATSTSKLPDLLDTTAALSGLAATKRSSLASPLLPEGTARLLERQG
jgi:flagellar capping protein FliD